MVRKSHQKSRRLRKSKSRVRRSKVRSRKSKSRVRRSKVRSRKSKSRVRRSKVRSRRLRFSHNSQNFEKFKQLFMQKIGKIKKKNLAFPKLFGKKYNFKDNLDDKFYTNLLLMVLLLEQSKLLKDSKNKKAKSVTIFVDGILKDLKLQTPQKLSKHLHLAKSPQSQQRTPPRTPSPAATADAAAEVASSLFNLESLERIIAPLLSLTGILTNMVVRSISYVIEHFLVGIARRAVTASGDLVGLISRLFISLRDDVNWRRIRDITTRAGVRTTLALGTVLRHIFLIVYYALYWVAMHRSGLGRGFVRQVFERLREIIGQLGDIAQNPDNIAYVNNLGNQIMISLRDLLEQVRTGQDRPRTPSPRRRSEKCPGGFEYYCPEGSNFRTNNNGTRSRGNNAPCVKRSSACNMRYNVYRDAYSGDGTWSKRCSSNGTGNVCR